jgi:hypothetical protein
MDTVSAIAVAQTPWRGPVVPSFVEIASCLHYWRNAIYLGIGELSLTWPVAAHRTLALRGADAPT